jgi:hypothetical protein
LIQNEILSFKKRIYKRVLLSVLGLLLLSIIYLLFLYYQDKIEKDKIKFVVTHAMRAEFAAYKSLPKVDTTELLRYFTQSGNAYSKIKFLLARHSQSRRNLNDKQNPSSFKLYDYLLVEFDDSQDFATVKTMEHWYLRWYNDSTQTTSFIYNEMNNQFYYLRKQDETWKIDDNFYLSSTVNKEIR